MGSRLLTLILAVAGVFAAATLAPRLSALRLAGEQRGYEPVQPIDFSHRLHASELEIDCFYCHAGAERSRHAGIPAASVCMNCHRFVTAALGAVRAEDELAQQAKRQPRRIVAPGIGRLYTVLGLDEGGQRDPQRDTEPIAWTKVHNLPDYVYFDHRPHVAAGVSCGSCHGPVERMERVRQVESLTMGWCVHCHRRVNREGVNGRRVSASTDCSACHF